MLTTEPKACYANLYEQLQLKDTNLPNLDGGVELQEPQKFVGRSQGYYSVVDLTQCSVQVSFEQASGNMAKLHLY